MEQITTLFSPDDSVYWDRTRNKVKSSSLERVDRVVIVIDRKQGRNQEGIKTILGGILSGCKGLLTKVGRKHFEKANKAFSRVDLKSKENYKRIGVYYYMKGKDERIPEKELSLAHQREDDAITKR